MLQIDNEKIVAALIEYGTITDAAKALKCSRRAIQNRFTNGEFRLMYQSAKTDLMRAAVLDLNNKLSDAVSTIYEIMTDKNNNCAVRLQAAQTILNNAAKFAEHLQGEEYHINNIITYSCSRQTGEE